MTHTMAASTAAPEAEIATRAREVVSCPGNAFVARVRLVDGVVDEAWSTGRMVRNMNVLLKGELDAKGRPGFVHQAHCLCNDGHALAAIRAVEDLAGVAVPQSAVLVRRLVQSLRCIQEHLLHFHQFHLADWASLGRALRADPARTASLAKRPGEDAAHFRALKERLRRLAEVRGSAGDQARHDGAYRGPDELHLLLYGHSLEAVRIGRSLQEALALLDCGPKGFKAYRIGGLSEDQDLSSENLDRLRTILDGCREFVCDLFPVDLTRLARVYASWSELGAGDTLLTWDNETGAGLVDPVGGAAAWKLTKPDATAVREEREPQWQGTDRHRYRLFTGRDEPSFRWGNGAYFWLPAPRHGDISCEVGPLARVMGGMLGGDRAVERTLSDLLGGCGLPVEAMNSTLGRVLARGAESAALLRSLPGLLDELEGALLGGAVRLVDFALPAAGVGVGRVEVPRGALTHSIRWGNGRILNHDYLIPSLWNFSPRDTSGVRGPLERALIGTPVADAGHPVEILRTLHQLDPCNDCHVVVEDRDTGRISLAMA
ncbi:nickel-dependent hydrogenase large subunit [Desulfovibrio sp. Huiquan2017]|uniref:nickel-dependent hydrogenase large subunit n=1 Tax=Desulfovibrio sp. Huiquan2017 TaxID=2816861 RepID=UPI001A916A5F|nr:nickel-dependent hydrogenase large subunit [Desulfovibrio sp. Huiquan2017]